MLVSRAQEEMMGKSAYTQTLKQYGRSILPSNHPVRCFFVANSLRN
jgi:hypothetical protein